MSRSWPSDRSSPSPTESIRGNAPWKIRPGSTAPRPGVSLVICSATARPKSVSNVSLSRSSMRPPKAGCMRIRTSIDWVTVMTTWTP